MYEYRATLLKVVDGDTIDVEIDQGLETFRRTRLRLYGINCAEIHSPDAANRVLAIKAKQFVTDFLPVTPLALTIQTVKDRTEKYGRYLATVRTMALGPSLNEALVTAGLAARYMVDD